MTVRPATPADAAALAAVAAATFPLACPPSTTDAAKADFIATQLSEARFAEYLAHPKRVLLVEDPGGGAPLDGYAMLVLAEPTDADAQAAVRIRPTCELSKIYVLADAHGSGVAGRLLAAAHDTARAHGAAGMWLGTNVENARAVRFYEKHGFVKVGRKRFALGGVLEDDFVLERPLG